MGNDDITNIKQLCGEYASDADVYIEAFRKRARPLKTNTTLLRFGGLVVPITGSLVYLPEATSLQRLPGLSILLFVASVAVLLFSLISIVWTWDANLAYYYEAIKNYAALKQDFLKLAQVGHADAGVQNHVFEIVRTNFKNRRGLDVSYDITDQELTQARQALAQRYGPSTTPTQ